MQSIFVAFPTINGTHEGRNPLLYGSARYFALENEKELHATYEICEANGTFCLGALAPAASVTFVRTVSFQIYQKAKYKYSDAIGRATGGDEPLVVVNRPGSTPTLQTVACFASAGATAGVFVTAVACT